MKIGNTRVAQSSDYRFLKCHCDQGSHMFVNDANRYDTAPGDIGNAHLMRAAALRAIKSPQFPHGKRIIHATKSNGKWQFS